jgi:uncharacterized protein (DUF433 family)
MLAGTKIVVRLTLAEKSHIRTLAASQGLTLRQAILHAFAAWEPQLTARQPAAPQPAQPSPAAAGSQGPAEQTARARSAADRAGQGPRAPSGGSPVISLPARAAEWLRQAAGQLDWSKCPEAECLHGKTRKVWVVRDTCVPLAHILEAVAEGHPLAEIAEVHEITLQQLMAIVQFAVASAAPAALGR